MALIRTDFPIPFLPTIPYFCLKIRDISASFRRVCCPTWRLKLSTCIKKICENRFFSFPSQFSKKIKAKVIKEKKMSNKSKDKASQKKESGKKEVKKEGKKKDQEDTKKKERRRKRGRRRKRRRRGAPRTS